MPEVHTPSVIEKLRSDFPILNEEIHGKKLVYLDNGATAQKPLAVINAISDFYLHHNSNVHRGVHTLSQRATDIYESARRTVAKYLNAESDSEIIFTRGTTDSINMLANMLEPHFEEGDEIVTTDLEHHSNFVPWQMLAERTGAVLKIARFDEKGEIDAEVFESLITEKTKLVAVSHASNTLGSVLDIKAISEAAHKLGAMVAVDGAQYIPHRKPDMQKLDCDFYSFSAHKLFGPTGLGVLFGKKERLEKLSPAQYGGGMISEVTLEKTTLTDIPQVFEAGTPDISGAHGLAVAMDYVDGYDENELKQHEQDLLDYATSELKKIDGLEIYGQAENKVALVSFNIKGIHPFDIGTLLDKKGIAVRTGHHCTQPIMQKLNIPGTVRASFAFYNTKDEIDLLVKGINKAISLLK